MSFLGLSPSDAPALIDAASAESITYSGVLMRSREVAARLAGGRRLVFLLCRNDVRTTLVYVASQMAGHAVALLDGTKPLATHASALAAYRPDVVAGPDGTGEALAAGGSEPVAVTRIEGGELVAMAHPGSEPIHPGLALLLGTSGTTGSAKYVRLSRSNVEANARSIAAYLGISPDERPITSLPLHYSFGLSVLNSHWLSGAAVVLTGESVMQRSFWAALERFGCTSMAGVPYTYQMLERIGYRDMDLPALRTMQQAGGALDRALTAVYAEHMSRKRGRFFVMYGQTEATARIAYVPHDRLVEKLGSAGIAIPDGRLHIETAPADEPDRPASGEVVYEGPNVMLGYAEGRSDLAAGDDLHGVLRTGDIGYLDEDGYLFLTGRSKRIAKVFGLRVNLDEVETILRESGPAAVIAADDLILGYCAFGTDGTVAELNASLCQRLRLHPSAVRLRRVAEIPVSSSGKVDYRQVERWTEV
jgi:long-chain acyl-CoA synthetase